MLWIVMVVFGLVFLLGDFGILTEGAVTITWPVLVMAAGLTKLMGSKCKCCSHGGGACMNCGNGGRMQS
jgi:hypothetical protein